MRVLLFAMLTGLALTAPARTEVVSDLLFAEGIFDGMPDGQKMTYTHVRDGSPSPGFFPVTDGSIVVTTGQAADGLRSLSMTIHADASKRDIVEFPASGGNPVLMVFLESTVRSMAAITGGSPFYIRNRIKDALRQGGDPTEVQQDFAGSTIAAQEVILQPFKADPNRDRMGEFGDLSLRFVVSDAVPGHFVLLSANTPEAASGYQETITLTKTEGGQ